MKAALFDEMPTAVAGAKCRSDGATAQRGRPPQQARRLSGPLRPTSWYTSRVLLDELDVRRSAMAYLAEAMAASGGVVTRAQLEAFHYGGEQLKLIDQSRGIRNPRQLGATLSILSQPKGPYDDVETEDGLLRYAYRDGSPDVPRLRRG